MTNAFCVNYRCRNTADGSDALCAGCRAGERLVLAVNAAVEEFLYDRFPLPVPRSPFDRSSSTLFDGDSPARRSIFDAGGDLVSGLVQLVELAVGQRVYMTYGPWCDPYDGWHGGFAWDISEHQDAEKVGKDAS